MILLIALSVLYLIVIGAGLISWRREDLPFPPYALGGGILVVWILVLVGRPLQPKVLPLIPWTFQGLFHTQPALLIDHMSWVFFLVVASLILAYVFIFPGLNRELVWVLGLACAASLGIMSGNILTLLFSWMLVDVLQFGFHFRNRLPEVGHDQFVLSFAFRLVGPFLVVYAHFFSLDAGLPINFQVIAPRVAGLLILASGFRHLLTLPKSSPDEHNGIQAGQLTLIHSITGAVNMLIIIRGAVSGVPPTWTPAIYGLLGSMLLISGLWWVTSRDLSSGRNAWMTGWLVFVVLAAVDGQEMVSESWALAALLSGNLLFLLPPQHRLRYGVAGLLGVGILAWPYTPLWTGAALYSQRLWGVVWALGFGIFIAGGIRHVLRWDESRSDREPLLLGLHLSGVIFLGFVHVGLSLLEGLVPASAQFWKQGWRFLLPAIIVVPFLLARNRTPIPAAWISGLKNPLSELPGSITSWVLQLGRFFSAIVMGTFHILEGRAGLIWALVGVFFLLSVLASSGGG